MRPSSLAELAVFSAEIGRDPEQVQAAGGNTSIKVAGHLWVKASGLWLVEAERRELFVPVALDPVLGGIAAGADDPVSGAVVAALNPSGLRPSIETTLHALLPHAVVVHTHSVRTIALAVRADGPNELAQRLAGIRWAWIPYRKPGLPLTVAVAGVLSERPADVLVLGNHGLVVGAETVAAARALLAEVEGRLDGPRWRLSAKEPEIRVPGRRPCSHALAHALALETGRLERACTGSLYPDHVIFLGPAASANPNDERSRLFLAPGIGAFLPEDAGASADELARCLALVLERVPPDAALRYLTAADEAALLDWDAEHYRQAQARAAGR